MEHIGVMEQLSSLSDLFDLQQVDSEIDRLLERRQSLPELEEYRAASDRSDQADARLGELSQELKAIELEVDKAEGELEIMEQRVSQTEQRLFAGGMSARETENMRLEVESLRKQQSELESAVLEGLEKRDELGQQVDEPQAVADEARRAKDGLNGIITQTWKEIDGELARHEARKAEIVPTVDPELLELYDSLREHKEGVAIAALEDGVCGGCHLRLSAAELKEALEADPPRCTHCRRLLVP